MRGIVLAAGLGTRMRPLTDRVPKALLPLCGRPLLERALAFLALHGIGPIAVNAHHLHEQIAHYRSGSPVPFEISHEEDRVRGTGGALWYARDFLARDDTFAVCNVEPVVAFQFAPLLWRFAASGVDAALVSVPVRSEGTIFSDPATGDFLGTRDDPVDRGAAAHACFLGVALYRRRFLDLVTESDFGVQPVWHRARKAGMRVVVMAAPERTYWRDIGSPGQLAAAHFDVLDGVSPLRPGGRMSLDMTRHSAWPAELSQAERERVGGHVWIEQGPVPEGTSLQRCVVLPGAPLQPGRRYQNALVTAWGELPLG